MNKVLILLLVVGILVGTVAAIEGICEEYSSIETVDVSGEESGDGLGDPVPCGGGGGDGAGGGTPG